jgi:hypothetical protein
MDWDARQGFLLAGRRHYPRQAVAHGITRRWLHVSAIVSNDPPKLEENRYYRRLRCRGSGVTLG